MYNNIIFDLDDTLVSCSEHYVAKKKKFIDYAHGRTDVPKDIIEKIFNGIDLACTELPDGFSKERFPRSFSATSAVCDIVSGKYVDESACVRSYEIGNSVFTESYLLYPDVEPVLEKIYSNKNIFVYTKGDKTIQSLKLNAIRFNKYSSREHWYVTDEKNGNHIKHIMETHNLFPETTILVGDSLRDDIGSAYEAGIASVLVQRKGHQGWSYNTSGDLSHIQPTYTISKFEQLLPIFG